VKLLAGCASSPGKVPEPCDPAPERTPVQNPIRMAADAGEDFEVRVGERVRLNGTASVAFDGQDVAYVWDQTQGPCVRLDLSDPVRPSFRAPHVPPEGAVLVFRLTLQDGDAYSWPDEAEVHVRR